MKKRGRQVDLATSLQDVYGRLARRSPEASANALVGDAWAEVAGPLVTQHTTGAFLKDGTLTVYVDGPVWATELSAMSENYRKAINEQAGQELVREMRFTVSRKVRDQHRYKKADEAVREAPNEDDVPSVPLSPTERAQIEASVSAIADPELRDAVLRATVKDIEWKKGLAVRNSREAASGGS